MKQSVQPEQTLTSDADNESARNRPELGRSIEGASPTPQTANCLNDPQIIFFSKDSNSNIYENEPTNDRRCSQENVQYRVRSGTHRLALAKQQSTGNNTPSAGIFKATEQAHKGRSTSNGIVKPLKSAANKQFT